MTIAPVTPDDAPVLLHLAEKWGQRTFLWSAGSAGIVARDGEGIAGFALLCERPYGCVVDELWVERNRRGLRATSEIIDWVEAQERHRGGQVGGIVAPENPLYDVLRERGYTVTHHVLTKAVA
jgi:hypothetical protein